MFFRISQKPNRMYYITAILGSNMTRYGKRNARRLREERRQSPLYVTTAAEDGDIVNVKSQHGGSLDSDVDINGDEVEIELPRIQSRARNDKL